MSGIQGNQKLECAQSASPHIGISPKNVKYCECGCGQITPVAKRNIKSQGYKKGDYLRFCHGHNRRKKDFKNQTAIFCSLYDSGLSSYEISEKLGESQKVILYRLKKLNKVRSKSQAICLAIASGRMKTPKGNSLPMTDEQKKRLSLLNTGKKLKHKRKNPGSCGENHWNWKGGVTSEISKIRQTDEYRHWRDCVYRRDKYICQKCHSKTKKIIAHHIKSFTLYPEERFDIENGITLCRSCHKIEHYDIGKTTRYSTGK